MTHRRAGWRVGRVAVLVTCAAMLALSLAPAARAAPVTCPSTFAVLHDDRIGALQLAAGHHAITVLDSNLLGCAEASDLLRQFLEDWDGRLPRPWTLDVASATFTRAANAADGFRVALAATPAGGGGGRHPASGTACPAYFHVLHADHIGALELPAGEYRITLLAVGRLSCARAAAKFAGFLQDFDGRLPRRWLLDPATGTFLRGAHVGFRVKLASGPPPTPARAGTHPEGARCPASFRVRNDDRVGRLRLPRGRYRITLLDPDRLTCGAAAGLLREFLQHPAGDLPEPWVVSARAAAFTRGRGSSTGFRLKPARPRL